MLRGNISLFPKVSVDVYNDCGHNGKEKAKSKNDGVTDANTERSLAPKE